MLDIFFTALARVALLGGLAIPGFVLQKLNKLPEQTIGVLCALMIYLAQPVQILYSFVTATYSKDLLLYMAIALVIAIVFNFGFFLLARLIFSGWSDKKKADVATLSASLSNCGFMGIPLIQLLFKNPAITIFAVIYVVAFNIVLWTFGVYVLTGDKSYVSIKKAFLNLPTIVLVIALPIFFLNLNLASSENIVISSVLRFLQYFNDFSAVFPMMILGIRLATMNAKSLVTDKHVYITSAFKLIVFPLIGLGLILLLRLIPIMQAEPANFMATSLLIAVAMPSATMAITFAETFDADKEMAVKCTLVSTILALITVPLFISIFPLLGIPISV